MIRFERGDVLYLLWVLPILVAIAWWENRWYLKAMIRWAAQEMWEVTLPQNSPNRILLKRILTIVSIGVLIIGIAGPQVGTTLREVKREGVDIALVVDISSSMLSEDIAPNRNLRTRSEIGRLLNKLRGDRVALIFFANAAHIQIPLTLDYSTVMSLLNLLGPETMPAQGTLIARGIEMAAQVFQDDSPAARVMVLISDGEDQGSKVVKAAELAAEQRIVIHTIGMATYAGGPIPEKNDQGQVTGYKKDKNGNTVLTRLNEQLLTDIATATGGNYYRATQSGDEFKQVYKHIFELDKAQFEERQYTDYEDRFQWLLAMSLLLIVIEQIIPSGRRRWI